MASVSNSFDLLTGGQVGAGASSKKRNRKKGAKKVGGIPSDPATTPAEGAPAGRISQPIPSSTELESSAKNAKLVEDKLDLCRVWMSELETEDSMRRSRFVGEDGSPVSFRSALVECHALEFLIESCVGGTMDTELESSCFRLFEACLVSTEPEVIQQLFWAVGKASIALAGKGKDVSVVAKRAIGAVVSAMKSADSTQSEQSMTQWKKKGAQAKQDKAQGDRKRTDKKSEYDVALGALKAKQREFDAVRDNSMSGGPGVKSMTDAAERTISDLKTVLSAKRETVGKNATNAGDGFEVAPKRGKKKGKGQAVQSPVIDTFNKEESALHDQESKLSAEIMALETRLTSLKAQKTAIKEAKMQLSQRKTSVVNSLQGTRTGTGEPVISAKDQAEVVTSLESVLSQLQNSSGPSANENQAFAVAYVEAAEKFLQTCIAKQDDVMKRVKFLKDSLRRRKLQMEQVNAMGTPSLKKELLASSRKAMEDVEGQLHEVLREARDAHSTAQQIVLDVKTRAEMGDIEGVKNIATFDALGSRIKRRHTDIISEGSVTKEEPTGSPQSQQPRKKIDVQAIIREAQAEAAESLAQMDRPRNRGQNKPAHGNQTPPQPRMNGQAPISTSSGNSETQPPPSVASSTRPAVSEVLAYDPVVQIPSAQDEMVPAPEPDRVEAPFSPVVVGGGVSQTPTGHLNSINDAGNTITPPPPPAAVVVQPQPRPAQRAPAPGGVRAWKKIPDQTPVEQNPGMSFPTLAEAGKMKGKK